MPINLKKPAGVDHVPWGREYLSIKDADAAWAEFVAKLDALVTEYGLHSHIFNGQMYVRNADTIREGKDGAPETQILTKAMADAGGCKLCLMFAIAQGAAYNPDQNEILFGAYQMLEEGLEEQQRTVDARAVDLNTIDVKGPKQ